MAQAKRENAMEVVSLTALIEMKPMTCECMRQWVCVRVRCAWAQDRWKWKRKRNEIQWPKRQPHYHFSIFVMLLLIWHMPCARQMTAKYFDSSSCRVGPRDEKSETKLLERTSEIFLIFLERKTLGQKTIEIWIWIILITWKRDRRQAFKRCCWCRRFVVWHRRTTPVFARPFPCHFAVFHFFFSDAKH